AGTGRELAGLTGVGAGTSEVPDVPDAHPVTPGRDRAVLATWRQLLDNGVLQDDEPHLAGTARGAVARLSETTASRLRADDGQVPHSITVATDRGAITLPLAVADLPDGVVWLPANSAGSRVRADLGVGHGALVSIGRGEP